MQNIAKSHANRQKSYAKHCKTTCKTLQNHMENLAKFHAKHCKNTCETLQRHVRNLQNLMQNVAESYAKHCKPKVKRCENISSEIDEPTLNL